MAPRTPANSAETKTPARKAPARKANATGSTGKPRAARRSPSRNAKPADRRFGMRTLAAGAAALGLAGSLAAAFFVRRRVSEAAASSPAEHAVPDLAADAPRPGTNRAPEAFRPDPTAVPTAEERESLRPATGAAPSLAADRGTTIQ
jgi:hypothetical protein